MTWFAWFLLGTAVGALGFTVVLAVCAAAGDADRRLREGP